MTQTSLDIDKRLEQLRRAIEEYKRIISKTCTEFGSK